MREALKTQRELLMKAERRLQGAKQRTKELLDDNVNDWEGLEQGEHRRCLEFDRRQWKLMSLIAILEDSLENFADAGENDETPAEEEVPSEEAPAEEFWSSFRTEC